MHLRSVKDKRALAEAEKQRGLAEAAEAQKGWEGWAGFAGDFLFWALLIY